MVAVDARVGDLEQVVPAVHEDTAAALRAVDDAHAVDARRVALEVGRTVVGFHVPKGERGCAVRNRVPQVAAAVGERAGDTGCALAPEVGARTDVDAATRQRDARTFIGAHQRRLLQDLREVPVAGRVPANEGFERNPVGTEEHARRAVVGTARIEGRVVGVGCTVDGQAEQARDLAAPRVHLAGRMRVGVDRDRAGAHALQAHRLPHDQVFLVRAGADDDQVARAGVVDRGLQRVRVVRAGRREGRTARAGGAHVGRRLAADRHSDRVDRFLAVVGSGDDELAAARSRVGTGVGRVRDVAQRRQAGGSGGYRCGDRVSAPGCGQRVYDTIAADEGDRSARSETVVPRDGLLVVRRGRRVRPRVVRVLHDLAALVYVVVAKAMDRQRLTARAQIRATGSAI